MLPAPRVLPVPIEDDIRATELVEERGGRHLWSLRLGCGQQADVFVIELARCQRPSFTDTAPTAPGVSVHAARS